jgi:hypothetical protein
MPYRVAPLRRAITKVPALDTATGGSPLGLAAAVHGTSETARRHAVPRHYSRSIGTMNATGSLGIVPGWITVPTWRR